MAAVVSVTVRVGMLAVVSMGRVGYRLTTMHGNLRAGLMYWCRLVVMPMMLMLRHRCLFLIPSPLGGDYLW